MELNWKKKKKTPQNISIFSSQLPLSCSPNTPMVTPTSSFMGGKLEWKETMGLIHWGSSFLLLQILQTMGLGEHTFSGTL